MRKLLFLAVLICPVLSAQIVHGPQVYLAPTDSAVHPITRSTTPPPEWTWQTDPDFLQLQKSALFPAATNNGTAYFMCGANTVALAHAIDASVPLTASMYGASASELNEWSVDSAYVIVPSSAGGRDFVLGVDTITPKCTVKDVVNGLNGFATNGSDPIFSRTEPGVMYGNTTGTVTPAAMKWNVNTNTVTTLVNWATSGNFPSGAPPVGPANAFGTIADITGAGHDSMFCAAIGSAAAPNTYAACLWLPNGAIAWWDSANDNTGSNGLAFGPLGIVPTTCSTGSCTGVKCTTGIHAEDAGTDGTNLYTQVECMNTQGVGPIIWKVGTTTAANATPISGGGHRGTVGSQMFTYNSGAPGPGTNVVGVNLATPTISAVSATRQPCSSGSHCDDQHNSGIAVLGSLGLMTSGDYYFVQCAAGQPLNTCPQSASYLPTIPGSDEVIAQSLNLSTVYRFTRRMTNAAIDCTLDANNNCVSNASGFFNLVGGNVAPCGCLYDYSSNYNGFWGKPAGAATHINYIFIMEMLSGSKILPGPSPASFAGVISFGVFFGAFLLVGRKKWRTNA